MGYQVHVKGAGAPAYVEADEAEDSRERGEIGAGVVRFRKAGQLVGIFNWSDISGYNRLD
jgi:hypothetical protein